MLVSAKLVTVHYDMHEPYADGHQKPRGNGHELGLGRAGGAEGGTRA